MPPKRTPPIEVASTPRHALGMPPAAFLRDYWQKRPLLIRGAFPRDLAPLAPDDLAGLACEDAALARVVVHDAKRDRWSVRNGPFAESDFASLPRRDWTLLVQDVDKWDADVAALLASFRFLPSWRVDDVMVSYAVDGGSVGAHVDQYDVFLIQGLGCRRWRIDVDPRASTDFRPDVELKLLRTFAPSHDWALETGDALYLPPGVPHHGVAIGECMTYSVGMRAPSVAELAIDFVEQIAESLGETRRFVDPDLAPARSIGEIDAAALRRVAEALAPLGAHEPAALATWFGRFITRYRATHAPLPPRRPIDAASLAKKLASGAAIVRHPWVRFAWTRSSRGATLFAGGEAVACSHALAERVCAQAALGASDIGNAADRAAVCALINSGALVSTRVKRS